VAADAAVSVNAAARPPTSCVVLSPPVHCATKFSASLCDSVACVGDATLPLVLPSDGMLAESPPKTTGDLDDATTVDERSTPFALAASVRTLSAGRSSLFSDSEGKVRDLSVLIVLAMLLMKGRRVSVVGLSLRDVDDVRLLESMSDNAFFATGLS